MRGSFSSAQALGALHACLQYKKTHQAVDGGNEVPIIRSGHHAHQILTAWSGKLAEDLPPACSVECTRTVHTLDRNVCRRCATEKKSAKNNVWIQDVKFGAEIVSSWCLFVGTMIRWWWRGGQQRYQAVCNDIVRGSLSIVDCVDVVVTPKVWYLKEM